MPWRKIAAGEPIGCSYEELWREVLPREYRAGMGSLAFTAKFNRLDSPNAVIVAIYVPTVELPG